MCGQAPSREVLVTRFYCWSEPEGEVQGSAPKTLGAPERRVITTRYMLVRSQTLRQQFIKCAVNLLLGKGWWMGVFGCSLSLQSP